MKTYEYYTLTNDYYLQEGIQNELGKEGWELITHVNDKKAAQHRHIYTFIREKITVEEDEFENYKIKTKIMTGHGFHAILLSQEEFIEKIKTDDEFAKTWKLIK